MVIRAHKVHRDRRDLLVPRGHKARQGLPERPVRRAHKAFREYKAPQVLHLDP